MNAHTIPFKRPQEIIHLEHKLEAKWNFVYLQRAYHVVGCRYFNLPNKVHCYYYYALGELRNREREDDRKTQMTPIGMHSEVNTNATLLLLRRLHLLISQSGGNRPIFLLFFLFMFPPRVWWISFNSLFIFKRPKLVTMADTTDWHASRQSQAMWRAARDRRFPNHSPYQYHRLWTWLYYLPTLCINCNYSSSPRGSTKENMVGFDLWRLLPISSSFELKSSQGAAYCTWKY